MFVCESEFTQPDRENVNFSFGELDFYSWIPQSRGESNHRLSLRKNLVTDKYEVYRAFAVTVTRNSSTVLMLSTQEYGKVAVVFVSDSLQEALDFGDGEVQRFHDHNPHDKVCTHEYPNRATLCGMKK